MDHPKAIGDRSTLAIMLALQAAGYAIFAPFGENTRYDLAIDDGTELQRVQCKTGRLRMGAVRFAVCSTYGHHFRPGVTRRDYHGDVDAFAVYCPETAGVYLLPIEVLPVSVAAALRVDAPRNNQSKKVRFARDYEVARVTVVTNARAEPVARAGGSAPCA